MEEAARVSGEFSKDVQKYIKELDAAKAREDRWRKKAKKVVDVYESEDARQNSFNVLYSNTDTLMPSLYNQLPKAVVTRRFNDEDPVGKLAGKVAERVLNFLLDSNDPNYTEFDEVMRATVLEGLVAGRGATRIKYEADIQGEGDEAQVDYETVCSETIPWDRMLHGYAKQWKDVPWIAIEHFLSREDLEDLIGKAEARKVPLTASSEALKAELEGKNVTEGTEADLDLGHVYEIWDKSKKKIVFVCPACPDVLKEQDDPLKLSAFFPVPRPLTFYPRVSGLTPAILYETYQEQAEELNKVTARINAILQALKVRGFYDGSINELGTLLEAEDNTLLAANNVGALTDRKIETIIWFMPLTELITVLQQLYLQRTQIKTVIYEITGISDIARGSTAASETAHAQELKSQWGTLRLKKMQKEVSRYARDLLRLQAEVAFSQFSQETVVAMTGMKLPTQMEKQQAQAQLEEMQLQRQMQEQAMQGAEGGEGGGEGGGEAALQEMLQIPSWEEVLELLSQDIQRNYKIDIETNSTVDLDATEEKEQVGEFLNALAQFLNGVAPMVENGTMPFEVAKEIMLAVTRRYRFGTEVEEVLQKMTPPEPKEDPKAAAVQAAEQMKLKLLEQQGQASAQESQMRMQELQAKLESDKQAGMLKAQLAQADFDLEMKRLQAENSALFRKEQMETLKFQQEVRLLQEKGNLARVQGEQAEQRAKAQPKAAEA